MASSLVSMICSLNVTNKIIFCFGHLADLRPRDSIRFTGFRNPCEKEVLATKKFGESAHEAYLSYI